VLTMSLGPGVRGLVSRARASAGPRHHGAAECPHGTRVSMDFDALLWQAIRRCDGQSGLARRLGYNKNSIRQWLLGLALPDATVEPRLAEFAGVTPDVLRQGGREGAVGRWGRARGL